MCNADSIPDGEYTYCHTVLLSPRVLVFVTYSSRHFYRLVFVTYWWCHFLEYIIQFSIITVIKYYHTAHVVFMQKEPYNNTYCHTVNVVIHRNSLHTRDTDNHTPESMSYFPHRNSLHTDGHQHRRH